MGVKVHTYPLRPSSDVLMCDANPLHNVWISAWGEVVPCAYLTLPGQGNIPRLFWGKAASFPSFSFGKVTDGLDRVLSGKTARSFRQAFARRLQADTLDTIVDEVPSLLSPRSTLAGFLKPLAQMTSLTKSATPLPPPDLCRNCYKLFGL